MKGNAKRLAVLVIITIIATFMMADTVTAEWRKHRFIQGVYAATGSGTCLAALYGLNPDLTPKAVPDVIPEGAPPFAYQLLTCTTEGVYTFHPNGKGHAVRPSNPCIIHDGREGGIPGVPPGIPFNPPFAPAAADSKDKFRFTYEVKRDGSITLTQVPGSHRGSFVSGPPAEDPNTPDDDFKYSNENRDWHGKVSPDGKTILLNAGLPDIITTVGKPENLVCNLSSVLIWMNDISWGWKHDQDDDDDYCHDHR
jgi:hypothetical protein